MRRMVSVWLPQWPIERLRLAALCAPSAAATEHPLVLVTETTRGLVITALAPRAAALGLQHGMTLADARARVPALAVRPATPAEDRQALRRLTLWCSRYGASVAVDGVDGILIDISGTGHLFGGEAGLVADLDRQLRRFGLTPRIGLADTAGAAAALARAAARTPALAPAGGSAAALAPLPVEALRLEPGASRLLHRFGLGTIGALAAVPRVSIERRFPRRAVADGVAHHVLDRLDRALGHKGDPLVPLLPPPVHAVRMDFAEPMINAAGIAHGLVELTAALVEQLAAAQHGARRIVLTLYRSDGSVAVIGAGLSRPSRDGRHLQRLLEEKLANVDAGFGIDLMVLAARVIEALPAEQLQAPRIATAGVPITATDATADALIDRIAGRLGAANLVRLVPIASHIPERAQARRPALDGVTGLCRVAVANAPLRPPFLFDRPEPISVVAGVPDGPPACFRWRRVPYAVVASHGPERITPEWWREIGASAPSRPRDYYAVAAADGGRFWLFRAGLYGAADMTEAANPADKDNAMAIDRPATAPRWYLHGVFA